MHHPAYTNGSHGGSFNFGKHIFPFNFKIPLPVIGTLVNQVRSQGGVSPQDRSNSIYDKLMKRLITMSQSSDRLIFVSGHEHSLQYIENDGLKQIVSGSGSKNTAVSLRNDGKFSFGGQGYAVLDVFVDGSSQVSYYDAANGESKLLFKTAVHDSPIAYDTSNLPSSFESSKSVSAYKKERTE